MRQKQRVFKLITQIAMRQEDFGGLVFMTQTGEVIQLNHPGFRLLRRISENKKIRVLPENLIFLQKLEVRGIISEVRPDE